MACSADTASSDPTAQSSDPLAALVNLSPQDVCPPGRSLVRCHAKVLVTAERQIKNFATPQGYAPADIQSAYNLPSDADAAPATVAITDAFDYPIAEKDLATYRSQFGLPPCTTANGCFTKVNKNGQASPLPNPPPSNDDWTGEGALDLDAVSAACPK